MDGAIRRIVIVGGGTAGWLAAARLAAAHGPDTIPLDITLVESPDVATIGVGEGTWPTMRRTLARIGIAEDEFLLACDGAFKQGSRFRGWATGAADDAYYHPFTPPAEIDARDAVATWRAAGRGAYADAVSPQPAVAALGLAPRQRAMPPYAGALNYAYHLDAAKFAALLCRHATGRLGVRHLRDHVVAVERADDGDIAAVRTRSSGTIAGDLFLDCTGHAGLLIGETLGVGLADHGSVLFNDRALAAQVPVEPDSPVASQTDATAHDAGWIWDIGLPTRRGVGCVYASAFASDADAEATLRTYLARTAPHVVPDALSFRKLAFRSAHRRRFWERNCLAVGLAAGFLEPLEASAIVLIELTLDMLIDNFPATRALMDTQSARLNMTFAYRWERIVEFLKLHYAPSRRDEPYWRAHRDPASWPARLPDLLALWRHQPPGPADLPQAEEIFPWASYQYVLYGMGFPPPARPSLTHGEARAPGAAAQRARQLAASLPDHRAYFDALRTAPAVRPGAAAAR